MYKEISTYTEILNPMVDKDNKVIKSEWRNSANSYGSAIYKFKRGKFVIVKPLQSNQVQDTRLQTL